MIDPDLMGIMACPETHQPLRAAEPGLLADMNRGIAEGKVRNRAGQLIQQPLEEALVRDDGEFLYPILEGLPVLLVDEAIPVFSPAGKPSHS